MVRSIFAVIAGFIAWTALWMSANAALFAALPGSFREDGSTDSVGILFLIFTYSTLFSVAAGLVTAMVAKKQERGHALAVGVLLLAVGILVQVQYWDTAPVWYHLIFLGQLVPASLLGASLKKSR
jgi:hypothetical protein